MRCIIDCFKLVKGAGKSIGIYNVALNLVRNISSLSEEYNIDITILGNEYNQEDFEISGVDFVKVNINPRNKLYCIFWELFDVVKYYKRYNADAILLPRGYTSLFHSMNDAILVHDMIPFYYATHYSGYFNRLENAYIMNRLKASIRNANKVITISEASKRDILDIVHVSDKKISVINNGRNRIDVAPMEHKDYIVAMTSGLPHKNAKGIVRSYEEYAKSVSNPLPLKIIGIDDASVFATDKSILDSITCYKYIKSNEDMHKLIGEAKLFLFLSEIEGFGFPPVEAMELGVPVICSNCSSLPEVVGDAAVLVDPKDYNAVGQAISELLCDEDRQKLLVDKGLKNIERFGWDKIARKYLELLVK